MAYYYSAFAILLSYNGFKPNSSGLKRGHTLSEEVITEDANTVPIRTDSARFFP